MSRPLTIVSIVSLLAVAPAVALAATLKVPKQFPTIQAAVNAAGQGDTILVNKGVYNENVSIGAIDLTVCGKKGAVIDGGGVGIGILVGFSDQVIIKNFTVRNTGVNPGIAVSLGGNVRVTGCKVDAAGGRGIDVSLATGTVVSKNTVSDAGGDGIYIESDNVLVCNNKIKDSAVANIRILGSNNTIEDNTLEAAGLDALIVGNGGGITTKFNLIQGNKVLKPSPIQNEDGIVLSGAPNTWLIDNMLSGMNAEGIDEEGDGSVIQGNTIKKVSPTGLEFASRVAVIDNKVSNTGDHGLDAGTGSDNSYVAQNVIKKAGITGVRAASDSCVFIKNKATKSANLDLSDLGTGNVFIENTLPKVL